MREHGRNHHMWWCVGVGVVVVVAASVCPSSDQTHHISIATVMSTMIHDNIYENEYVHGYLHKWLY